MTSSMTAFARVQIQKDWGSIIWEIRSVNHRYLEPHFRLAEPMRDVEPSIREILRKQLKRGKVECSLKYQPAENKQRLSVNQELLSKLHTAVQNIEQHFERTAAIDPLEVLRWPSVQNSEETDLAEVKKAAIDGFKQAVEQLKAMRAREGAELNRFIQSRLDSIEEEVSQLRDVLPDILDNQRSKLLIRLEEVQQELNPERLEQEMVLLAQKMDVDEELDRLNTHVGEVRRVLSGAESKKTDAIGRRLDFLMQELNREANTLSSKSINAGLTQVAVNLKVLIEQMREQIQNIE